MQLVGTIRLSELLAISLLPARIRLFAEATRDPRVKTVITLGIGWLASQCISNVFNESSLYDSARGCANIAVLLISFAVFTSIYWVYPNAHRAFLAGSIVSGVAKIFLPAAAGEFEFRADEQVWDRYVTLWGLPALALFASYHLRTHTLRVVIVGLCYGLAAIVFGGRSNGLIALAGTLLLYYSAILHRRPPQQRTMPSLIKLGIVGTLCLLPAFFAYVEFGMSGDLGKLTKRQLEGLDNPYNPLYVVAAARIEGLVSIYAIQEKPWLGHGSWAYDPKYDFLYEQLNAKLTGDRRPYSNRHRVIPSHSVIFGSWMFGGIAAFIFWLAVLAMIVQRTKQLLLYGDELAQAVACVFFAYTLWHLFFSPMGYARYHWPANMAFLLAIRINSPSCGDTHAAFARGRPPSKHLLPDNA